MTAAPAGEDVALDFAAVAAELDRLGIRQRSGLPLTERQVRRMADNGRLPFFHGPQGFRLLMRSALHQTVQSWQAAALRAAAQQRAEAEQARRPKGRAA
ncbi:MAG: hypothetical protein DI527_18160 [Chelatococcus sp.]|nr:MAG: hypothetical protein DI527_18160 [Chelatococcus sp.]